MKGIVAEPNLGVDQDDSLTYAAPGKIIMDETKQIRKPLWRNFIPRRRGQRRSRLGWSILSTLFQMFVAVPVTLITAWLNGKQTILWIPCVITFLVTQIINLAGLSTKTIVPAFYAAIVIDIGLIALSFIL